MAERSEKVVNIKGEELKIEKINPAEIGWGKGVGGFIKGKYVAVWKAIIEMRKGSAITVTFDEKPKSDKNYYCKHVHGVKRQKKWNFKLTIRTLNEQGTKIAILKT